MTDIRDLKKSLRKAEAALRRAQAAYSTCLLTSDHSGCATEQETVTRAEHEVAALRRRIVAAERQVA